MEPQIPSTLSSQYESTSTNTTTSTSIDGRESPSNDSPKVEIDINELSFISMCGKGMYGTVYKGKYGDRIVAIKEMTLTPHQKKNPKNRKRLFKDFQREAQMLAKLKHINIVEYIGLANRNDHPCIITEYLSNGTLYDLVQKKPFCLTQWNILSIARDIASGCHFLHQVLFSYCFYYLLGLNFASRLEIAKYYVKRTWCCKGC